MTAGGLLNTVREVGLKVALSDKGAVTVRGDEATLARWRPVLREHKLALQAALLAEHAQDIEAALACVMPRAQAHAEAMAATGLLARNTGCPWVALRDALHDETLPNTTDPVDRPPYGLPAWCLAPKTGIPIRQGQYSQPQP
ncbi:MAG: hypothetical protein P3W87_004065 [Gammaproteobacteria bacterium]|nr:hypothetical protein [Gammaproteobacteria bacterium]